MRKTAKERGMEIGKDIKLLYHKGPPDALSTFLVGNADGVIITPPQTEMARSKGFPVIIDFYEKGLKIIGPGTGVARAFVQKNPNTLKIFLMGYLDGVKRSLDDPAYAQKVLAQTSKITDAKLLEDSYQEGVKVWNKDMTVDPDAIKLVLEQSTVAKAAELDPETLLRQHADPRGQSRLRIEAVSRPGEISLHVRRSRLNPKRISSTETIRADRFGIFVRLG